MASTFFVCFIKWKNISVLHSSQVSVIHMKTFYTFPEKNVWSIVLENFVGFHRLHYNFIDNQPKIRRTQSSQAEHGAEQQQHPFR